MFIIVNTNYIKLNKIALKSHKRKYKITRTLAVNVQISLAPKTQ